MTGSPTALVIGSGFGGLAAALRLKAKGYEVTIVERQPDLGGRARVFRRNGFVYDAGPTVVTAPFLLDELFKLFNRNPEDYLKIVPVEPWYRFRFNDGETFDYGGTVEGTLDEIERLSPEDRDGYLNLVQESRRIFEKGFSELAHIPFHRWSTMLRQVPALLKLRSYRSVYQMVSAHLKDERLRQAFSIQPLLVGGNPFTTTSIYSLIHYLERKWGVHFAMGGTGAIVAGLEKLLREEGVQIKTNATVTKIITQQRRVTGVELGNSGEVLSADLVVCNADPPFVYEHLLDFPQRKRWSNWRLRQLRYSMGLFVLYFGTTRQYPGVAHHTITMGPRYKELLSDIFHKKHLAEDMSLYLHRPTATDPTMAPAGCDTFYVLSPVPNNLSGINWEEVGPRYRDAVVKELERTLLPGLSECITEDFFVTPDYFEQELLTRHGTGFSIQPLFTQSANFRFHNKSEEVDGLYFVGAGTHPGAGMPGVLSSAKVLDQLIPSVSNNTTPLRALEKTSSSRSKSETQTHAAVLAYHGKSFHWAGRLLPQSQFNDASLLYAFCRHVDDLADEASDPREAKIRLDQLRQDLWSDKPKQPLNQAFRQLMADQQLEQCWVEDLIEGVLSDLGEVCLQTQEELICYAYRVAGTVGLMMAQVLGCRDPHALAFATDLGIAMQLTNIARDVHEDAQRGRLYIPQQWLGENPVSAVQLIEGNQEARHAAETAVERLLDLAELYYRSGYQGMRYLPMRVRLGILTARALYRAIGDEIYPEPRIIWERRARVSMARKCRLTITSLFEFLFDTQTWPVGKPQQHEPQLHQHLNCVRVG
ncbi:MAG: phytoene desaturase family protein [bacterium]